MLWVQEIRLFCGQNRLKTAVFLHGRVWLLTTFAGSTFLEDVTNLKSAYLPAFLGGSPKLWMVTEQIQTTTCPRYGYTQAVHLRQVPYLSLFVRADQRNEDDIVFLPLQTSKTNK